MKQPHTTKHDNEFSEPAKIAHKPPAEKPAEKPVEQKPAEPKAVKFEPKLESKDDHVSHIAALARRMKETQPGVETFASQILVHVAAIQDPETHNRAETEKQRLAAEEQARRAKELGRPLSGDKAKVA
jgi:hypothetical protein